LQLSPSSSRLLYGSTVTISARAASVPEAVLQQRSPDGAWLAVRNVRQPTQLRLQPRASTAFRLVAPGTNGTLVSVAVAPRVQVRAETPRLPTAEASPPPDAAAAAWPVVPGPSPAASHPAP